MRNTKCFSRNCHKNNNESKRRSVPSDLESQRGSETWQLKENVLWLVYLSCQVLGCPWRCSYSPIENFWGVGVLSSTAKVKNQRIHIQEPAIPAIGWPRLRQMYGPIFEPWTSDLKWRRVRRYLLNWVLGPTTTAVRANRGWPFVDTLPRHRLYWLLLSHLPILRASTTRIW